MMDGQLSDQQELRQVNFEIHQKNKTKKTRAVSMSITQHPNLGGFRDYGCQTLMYNSRDPQTRLFAVVPRIAPLVNFFQLMLIERSPRSR